MKQHRKFFVLLLAALLALTACSGQEEEKTGSIVYVPEEVNFSNPLDQTESACVSGETFYLLGTVRDDETYAEALTLVRVPLGGGRAEELSAFHPAKLETDQEYESIGGYLRPGADGTLWLTESVYISGQGISLVLRQLDSEGNELAFFNATPLPEELKSKSIYDLWTNKEDVFFVNTGDKVALLDKSGTAQALLDGGDMILNRFITLTNGLIAIAGTTKSAVGYSARLRAVDPIAGDWADESFPLPFNAECFQSSDEAVLFYYRVGNSLYAWRQGAEEAELLMDLTEVGINANRLAAFSALSDGRLAVVVYNEADSSSAPQLILLSSTGADALPERTELTLSAITVYPDLQHKIADFNASNESCYISVNEYLPSSPNTTDADYQQALLRMSTEITAGNMPDILYLGGLPARRLEAQGMLENLWTYIENDPELGRDALMERPLQALEYNGGLYRIATFFLMNTLMGPKSVVGDRMTWTYDDFWAALESMPEDSAATGIYDSKEGMLLGLLQNNTDRFINWESCTCRFDKEEFRTLLEFCDQFPDSSIDSDIPEFGVYYGEQMLLPYPIYNTDIFQFYEELFGEEISFVGWPNGEGRTGTSFDLAGTPLSITSASTHKEEAWSFLRQQLLPSKGAVDINGNGFYINRTDFEQAMEQVMTPKMDEINDVLQEVPRTYYGVPGGENNRIPIDALTQEEYDQLMALYNAADGTSDYDVNLMNIITEQAGAYFAGDRSLDDTVAAIQSRVGLYLAELQ